MEEGEEGDEAVGGGGWGGVGWGGIECFWKAREKAWPGDRKRVRE